MNFFYFVAHITFEIMQNTVYFILHDFISLLPENSVSSSESLFCSKAHVDYFLLDFAQTHIMNAYPNLTESEYLERVLDAKADYVTVFIEKYGIHDTYTSDCVAEFLECLSENSKKVYFEVKQEWLKNPTINFVDIPTEKSVLPNPKMYINFNRIDE